MKRMITAAFFAFASGLCAEILIVAPGQDAIVETHNGKQIEYLTTPREKRREIFADQRYRHSMCKAGFYPLPTKLSWKVTQNEKPPFTVTISENPDFKSAWTVPADELSVSVDNLKIASTYYWKVSSGSTVSKTASFKTSDLAPRLIRVPNVSNIRDLGGRIGLNGRRVRQGLVYRSAGLNDNAGPVYRPRNEEEEAARVQLAENQLKNTEKLRKKDYIILNFPNDWTVFYPKIRRFNHDMYAETLAMTEIPETITGRKSYKVKADKDGKVVFPDHKDGIPSILIQTFNSPRDGWTTVSAGADWYWVVSVNGVVQFDLRNGNGRENPAENLYSFDFPVKKGKNIFVCALGSGSAGNMFVCVPNRKPAPSKDVRESRTYMLESVKKASGEKEIIGWTPGKSHVEGSSGEYMRNVLGIKSDIDLRSDNECQCMTGSPLGPSVTWFHYSSLAYSGVQMKGGKEAFKKVFRVFLDKKNYPIDFHCIAGQDRTGAVAFILNALLGVEEDQLFLDWEATGFWNPDANFNHKNLFDQLYHAFDSCPGKTINDRVYQYVLGLGFTQQEIETFRGIMLE